MLREDSDRYKIRDLEMDGYTLSVTILWSNQSTLGHRHPHSEAYYFAGGRGEIVLNGKRSKVAAGNMIQVESGVFHMVFNKDAEPLVFVCAWKDEDTNH